MSEHPDLGDSLHRLLRVVLDREEPLLRERGLDMWEYVVLSALHDRPAPTQNQLATAIGRDPTRLISILDRLQERELLERRSDPQDRRNRIVTLTPAGSRVVSACRSAIRAMEEDLLSGLPPRRREAFLMTVHELAAR